MQTKREGKVRRFLSTPFRQSLKEALARAERALKSVRSDAQVLHISDPASIAMLEETVERYQAILDTEPKEKTT